MLTKILFTAAVILVVALIYKGKIASRIKTAPAKLEVEEKSVPTAVIAYLIIGLIVAMAGFFYYLNWQEDHQVLSIKVINGTSGRTVTYKAMRKMMNGRRFETLDGRTVKLGESDRIEILEVE